MVQRCRTDRGDAGCTPSRRIRWVRTGRHALIWESCLTLVIDPDDLIFPRAATRVGPRYQANVPPKPSVDDAYDAPGQ